MNPNLRYYKWMCIPGEFDHTDICKKLMNDFDIHKIEYKYLNRETGLVDL